MATACDGRLPYVHTRIAIAISYRRTRTCTRSARIGTDACQRCYCHYADAPRCSVAAAGHAHGGMCPRSMACVA